MMGVPLLQGVGMMGAKDFINKAMNADPQARAPKTDPSKVGTSSECYECHHQNDYGMDYCEKCGTSLSDDEDNWST